MSELVAFLEQRLAEDEAVARKVIAEVEAFPTFHTLEDGDPWHCDEQSDHVAVAPARVLREVAAKRTILDGLRDAEAVIARIGPDLTAHGDAAEWANYHAWHAAAEAAAAVFSDHPDFQEQWR